MAQNFPTWDCEFWMLNSSLVILDREGQYRSGHTNWQVQDLLARSYQVDQLELAKLPAAELT